MSSYTLAAGLVQTIVTTSPPSDDYRIGYDIVINFISAEGLPKMDIIGYGDPYFEAKIDDKVRFISSIQSNTSTPNWDDGEWIVRNIPRTAKLVIRLYDKDDEKVTDDYFGQFEITDLIDYRSPPNGHTIIGPLGLRHGQFHLSIQSSKTSIENPNLPRYTFDGPCYYSRHNSLPIGRLTMVNEDCIYPTWKVQLRQIQTFFHSQFYQSWNRHHKPAQMIFNDNLRSTAIQTTIKMAHRAFYRRTLKNNQSGRLKTVDDLWKLFVDELTKQIKPCIYTYIIDDNTWRFSETGAGFFIDFASKHALLANASEHVCYAGEFHPRPKFGWENLTDEWELVFDNGSGTYAPNSNLLSNLKELFTFNFPGLNVLVYDHKDPHLKKSIEQLKLAQERYKNSFTTINQLLPPLQSFK
ncbi:unnamed protein product [Rotaria sordida]|uniref:C2 domain-containing protein n=2 Tax=Rotaria sordida TaxID=392033 RepID=A0A814EL11_9BILA|nr:unnamed protein product [Rotaria sordida]CAF3920129.1 unnamed protein product [Rotaria sordida]